MKKQVGNVQLMQKMNRLKVLNYIRNNPLVARPMVAEATGLSLSSITNIVSYLMKKKLISEKGLEKAERIGRKGILLEFNSRAYNFICVNLELSFMTVTLTDLEGKIKKKKEIELNGQTPKFILEVLKDEIKKIKEKEKEKILGIGIAISGLVINNGRYILSSSFKWKSINIKDELEGFTGLPVLIENTSIIKAAWQFYNKEQRDLDSMIFVDLEGGIGAVSYYKGLINRSVIGEIGHTTIEKNGPKCFCGNYGCLEAMCSVERIVSQYQEQSKDKKIDYNDFIKKFYSGDENAKKIIKECGEYLGIGLANLINVFYAELVIINGGEYYKCDEVIKIALECLRKRAYPVLTENLGINQVNVKIEEAIKGMAIILCQNIFDISNPYSIIE